jgi:hypothetical protein
LEFIRRFLQHVLPDGFMRIRHYGFLANRCRRQRLDEIRAALATPVDEAPLATPVDEATIRGTRNTREKDRATTTPATCPCPQCKQGRLIVIAVLPPRRREDAMYH